MSHPQPTGRQCSRSPTANISHHDKQPHNYWFLPSPSPSSLSHRYMIPLPKLLIQFLLDHRQLSTPWQINAGALNCAAAMKQLQQVNKLLLLRAMSTDWRGKSNNAVFAITVSYKPMDGNVGNANAFMTGSLAVIKLLAKCKTRAPQTASHYGPVIDMAPYHSCNPITFVPDRTGTSRRVMGYLWTW